MNKFAEELGIKVARSARIAGTLIPGTGDWLGQQVVGGAGIHGGYKPPYDSFSAPGMPVFRKMPINTYEHGWQPTYRGGAGVPMERRPSQGIKAFVESDSSPGHRPDEMKSVPGATVGPPPVGEAYGGAKF